MINNNRKGLSDVVTTVLIILLVLAAVAIIASYVLNAVNRGGAEVGGAAACTLMQLYPTECKYVKNTNLGVLGSSDTVVTYDFTLKATKRGSDINVKQLDVLLTDKASGDIKRKQNDVDGVKILPLKFLETSTIYQELAITQVAYTAGKYSSAGLAVTVVPEGGTASATCNPSKIVDCIETTGTTIGVE